MCLLLRCVSMMCILIWRGSGFWCVFVLWRRTRVASELSSADGVKERMPSVFSPGHDDSIKNESQVPSRQPASCKPRAPRYGADSPATERSFDDPPTDVPLAMLARAPVSPMLSQQGLTS